MQTNQQLFTGVDDDSETSAGMYFKVIMTYPVLSPERERLLFKKVQKGDDESLKELYNCNLRLVASIASRYRNVLGNQDNTIEFMDLIQAGNEGLQTAMKKFEWERGYKFSTYATPWIMQSITRFLGDNSRTIRLPIHIHEKVLKFKKIRSVLTESSDAMLIEDIALKMGVTVEEASFIGQFVSNNVTSLDNPLNDDNDDGHSNGSKVVESDFTDTKNLNPDKIYEQKALKQNIAKELSKYLSLREISIIEMRFGLRDGIYWSLEKIGELFGVTRERIRQIESKALGKLRDVPFLKQLFNEYIVNVFDIEQTIERVTGLKPKIEVPFSEILKGKHGQTMLVGAINVPHSELVQPYEYQIDCLQALKETRQAGQIRALALLASGLGKTVIAALDVALYRDIHGDDIKVLYICHKVDVLEQAHKIFRDVLRGDAKDFGFFANGTYNKKAKYLFATFQTIMNYLEEFKADGFDYIIIDEAHHSCAPTYEKVITHFSPKFLLGMTATPERGDNQDIIPLFGDNVVFSLRLEEALVRGLLPKIYYRLITDEIVNLGEITNLEKITIRDLNRRIFLPKRDDEILSIINRKIAEEGIENPRIVLFCSSIKYAEKLHKQFPFIIPIHSTLSKKEQYIRRERFRKGEYNIVVTINQFNEGVDIPEANVAVLLRQTTSSTIFYQQLGRLTRPLPDKNFVLVLDFVANCDRVEMIYSFAEEIKAKGEMFKTIYGDLIQQEENTLNIGNFDFVEDTRDIIKLIREVRMSKYNQADIIQQLQNEAKFLKKSYLGKNEIDEAHKHNRLPSLEVLRACFGSFSKALQKAGLSMTAPDGWLSKKEIMESYSLHIQPQNVLEVVKDELVEHPEWVNAYPLRNKKGTKEHYHPDLVEKITSKLSGRKPHPEGWMTASMLLHDADLRVSRKSILRLAETYRKEHKEWFCFYLSKSAFIEHYHPDLVLIIKQEFIGRKVASLGWRTAKSICKEKSWVLSAFLKNVKKYRLTKPEWFEYYYLLGNNIEHYHADLIKIIEPELVGISLPKKGWLTANSLGLQGGGSKTVELFANKYRKNHENWFKDFYVNDKMVEHYHPALCIKIKADLAHSSFVPDGWITCYKLSLQYGEGIKWTRIVKLANTYREEHPEWFQWFRSGMHLKEHYHPELVVLLRKQLELLKPPPNGWKTPVKISKNRYSTVKKFVESYRIDHPEWFKDFISNNFVVEHYHPELVAIVENLIKKHLPPFRERR